MPIFSAAELALLGHQLAPDEADLRRRLWTLQSLHARKEDGTLRALSERRVEQSFNERVFAEVFDYETLFRRGHGTYHLQPQNYHRGSGKYDDFSLGFFDPDKDVAIASAEFKSPGADLDQPQSGSYGGKTPVQQAFAAASKAARWILVSNFEEVRLYAASDATKYESVDLDDILSLADIRRCYALLSRPSLLGVGGDSASPLDLLYQGVSPMLISPATGQARLIQQLVLRSPLGSLGFRLIEDAILGALDLFGPPDRFRWPMATKLVDQLTLDSGRLVWEDEHSGGGFALEATAEGTLRTSERVPWMDGRQSQLLGNTGQPVAELEVVDFVQRVCGFAAFAERYLQGLLRRRTDNHPIEFELFWQLVDIDEGACKLDSVTYRVPPGNAQSSAHRTPEQLHPTLGWHGAGRAVDFAVNELLFPFSEPHGRLRVQTRTRVADATLEAWIGDKPA